MKIGYRMWRVRFKLHGIDGIVFCESLKEVQKNIATIKKCHTVYTLSGVDEGIVIPDDSEPTEWHEIFYV